MRPSRARPLQLSPSPETQPGLPRMVLTPKLQPRCLALSPGLLGQCPHFASIAHTHPRRLLEAGRAPSPLAGPDRRQNMSLWGKTSVGGEGLPSRVRPPV